MIHPLDSKLYIVPTPIGNLEDMTFRAIRVLKEVDLILAEDTRNSIHLLKHFQIEKPLRSYHAHNEHKTVEEIVSSIRAGKSIALVSDAGTPATSTETATAQASITEIQLGRHLSADKRVSDATTEFSPRDTIYAVALTQGSSPNATVTARWTYEDGGQVVKEDSRSIAASGTEATEFHISKPSGWPKGKYRVTLTLNGSTESKDFEVK